MISTTAAVALAVATSAAGLVAGLVLGVRAGARASARRLAHLSVELDRTRCALDGPPLGRVVRLRRRDAVGGAS